MYAGGMPDGLGGATVTNFPVKPFHPFDNEISIFDTVIEERDGDEVRYYGGARICPEGTDVINPAFDITPKELITGIITEKGIIDPI